MQDDVSQTIHATCVAIPRGRLVRRTAGVLLFGPSGSGKSDLALRLIDRGARLVADDQVVLSKKRNRLVACAPSTLRNRMEVRGVGIIDRRAAPCTTVRLAVRLAPGEAIERLPDPVERYEVGDCSIAMIAIDPFHASSPAKIEAAIAHFCRPPSEGDSRPLLPRMVLSWR